MPRSGSPSRRPERDPLQPIPVPPLNLLAAAQRPGDPWEEAVRQLSNRSASVSHAGARAGTPPRTPGGTTARSTAGGEVTGEPGVSPRAQRSGSQQRQRYGAWYVPPNEWASVYGQAGMGTAPGQAPGSPAAGSRYSSPPASQQGRRPGGVAAAAPKDPLAGRQLDAAVGLAQSYTARVFSDHLKERGLPPAHVIERVGTPTAEQVRHVAGGAGSRGAQRVSSWGRPEGPGGVAAGLGRGAGRGGEGA